jgi:hypothetical protein
MHKADLLSNLFSRCERQADSCPFWQGKRTTYGYGRVFVDGHDCTVHRLVWRLIHGAISDGMVVMHSCDQRVAAMTEDSSDN